MQPVTEKSWRRRGGDDCAAEELTRAGIDPLLARLLSNRGIVDPVEAGAFLTPTLASLHDPLLLSGMASAVERLAAAQEKGERVCVHGDYDVDGVTSVAVLLSFFRAVGIDAFPYIPKRLTEGYGLSRHGVEAAVAAGASVLVTADCGITSVAEAALCREAGIDLIITDHHAPPDVLPDAFATVNPLLPGCTFPFKSLAGVGVAFNLVIALRALLRRRGLFATRPEPDLKSYLDLVALGTVADVVPLVGENRVLVSYGLKELGSGRRIGVEALKDVAGVTGEVTCGAVGFRLAPRLNAAGRLEDAALGLELLLCPEPARARTIAKELDDANAERQALEKATIDEARAMLSAGACRGRKSIVLASPEWHPGVIGIVASRMVEIFHRPAILFAIEDGTGRGSGRSIARFHLLEAIKSCADHLLRFGGHSHAAGLSIAEEELERFAASFDAAADTMLDEEALTPQLLYDAELDADEIDEELPQLLAKLKPFGMGNPEPLFLLRDARVADARVLRGGHLKLALAAGGRRFDAIAFGLAEKGEGVQRPIDVLFSAGINVWNGKTSLQLIVKDLRPAEQDARSLTELPQVAAETHLTEASLR